MKLSNLLAASVAAGHIPESAAAAAVQHLTQREGEPEQPWYLHALVAVGAWLAAIFFVLFVGAIFGGFIFDTKGAATIIGAVLLVGVVVVRRQAEGAFLRQVCLAFSVTAHVLIFLGVGELDHRAWDRGIIPLVAVVLAAALYELYPDTLHRFLSSAGALVVASFWAKYEPAPALIPWVRDFVLAGHLAALGWAFVRPATPVKFGALGYALAVSLLVFALPHFDAWRLTVHSVFVAWDKKLILTFGLFALLLWVAGPWRPTPVWIAATAGLVAVGALTTPGILVSLVVLVLGFALQERLLSILGTVFLPLFLALHYYQLELTLLQKSIALAGAGLALLIVRAFVSRMPAPSTPPA